MELLTVIAVIAILASVLIAVIGPIRQRAAQTQCMAKLRDLGIATTLYCNEHNGYYMGYGSPKRWYQYLEPYLGPVTKEGILTCPTVAQRFAEDSGNEELAQRWPNYGYNFYFGDSSSTGSLGAPPAQQAQVLSPEKKMLFMDGGYNRYSPAETINSTAYKDYHNGGNHILFADGHVQLWLNSATVGQPPYVAGGAKDMWRPYYPIRN